MKASLPLSFFSCFVLGLFSLSLAAAPLGTAFTYQGRLNDGASPARGAYDFRFTLYDAATNGTVVGAPVFCPATTVTNGLFILPLDFGPGIFTGQARWLEIAVRTNSVSPPQFVILLPRTELTATPNALYSLNAGSVTAASIAAPQLSTTTSPTPGQVLAYDGTNLVWTSPPASVYLPLTVNLNGSGSGSVTSSPAGLITSNSSVAVFAYNSTVLLGASPNVDSTFTGWSGDLDGTNPVSAISMSVGHNVNATFTKKQFNLNTSISGNGGGTIVSSPAGISCPSGCAAVYDYGTAVSLSPLPNSGAAFLGWSGSVTGNINPLNLTMTNNVFLTATFTYPLSVSTAGTGSGTITSSPAYINCPGTCSTNLPYGTSVTLTATPAVDSVFSGWSGAASGTGSASVTLTGVTGLTATFTKKQFSLSVTKSGGGGGTITSSPGAIFCGGTCSANFDYGTSVSLSATPEPGAVFTGWSGAATGSSSPATVNMLANQSVNATFSYPVTVSKAGTGSGTVTSSPGGINCGAACSSNFSYGTFVTLSATPDANSVFTGWSGAATGSNTSVIVTATAARNVTATFTLK